jgi:acyl carrier protein
MRTADPLVQTVLAAIAEVRHTSPEEIDPDATLADLGLDSLDTVTMLFELETRLEITIPDDAAKSVRTVQDVVDGVRRLVEGAPPRAATSAS